MIDIERLAREAGFVVDEQAKQHQPNRIFHTHHMVDELLQRFAALVRNEVLEEAAKVADDCICDVHIPTGVKIYGTRAASAIRALKVKT